MHNTMVTDNLIMVYAFWVTSFFYILAGGYLIHRIKIKNLPVLYPLSIYLLGIAAYTFFEGLTRLTSVKLFLFLGTLAMVYGASNIARFPLRLRWPQMERKAYLTLLAVSLLAVTISYFTQETKTLVRVAHGYAFLVAGVFTIGYIIYAGIKMKTQPARGKTIGTGLTLGLCCVVAHGLVTFQLLATVALPLFGLASVGLPLIFAILAPVTFILVLIVSEHMVGQPRSAETGGKTVAVNDMTAKAAKKPLVKKALVKVVKPKKLPKIKQVKGKKPAKKSKKRKKRRR
jgi:hypothetical protein